MNCFHQVLNGRFRQLSAPSRSPIHSCLRLLDRTSAPPRASSSCCASSCDDGHSGHADITRGSLSALVISLILLVLLFHHFHRFHLPSIASRTRQITNLVSSPGACKQTPPAVQRSQWTRSSAYSGIYSGSPSTETLDPPHRYLMKRASPPRLASSLPLLSSSSSSSSPHLHSGFELQRGLLL